MNLSNANLEQVFLQNVWLTNGLLTLMDLLIVPAKLNSNSTERKPSQQEMELMTWNKLVTS